MSRTPFHQPRLLRAPSNPALNTAREGEATASLGNLCQDLVNLMVKNFFLIPNLNLPSFSLKPLPLDRSSRPGIKQGRCCRHRRAPLTELGDTSGQELSAGADTRIAPSNDTITTTLPSNPPHLRWDLSFKPGRTQRPAVLSANLPLHITSK